VRAGKEGELRAELEQHRHMSKGTRRGAGSTTCRSSVQKADQRRAEIQQRLMRMSWDRSSVEQQIQKGKGTRRGAGSTTCSSSRRWTSSARSSSSGSEKLTWRMAQRQRQRKAPPLSLWGGGGGPGKKKKKVQKQKSEL